MLKNEVTKQQNAIEEYFCKPFAAINKQAMDEELSAMFLMFAMSKDEVYISAELEQLFPVKIMNKRLQHCFNYTLDNRAKMFIVFLCDGVPGRIIMYLTYLQYECKLKLIKHLSFEEFAMIFKDGFPSDDNLHTLWQNTKVERVKEIEGASDNLIDYAYCLKSLL